MLNPFIGLTSDIRASLKHRGLLGTFRRGLLEPIYLFQNYTFDRRFGVDTGSVVKLQELGIDNLGGECRDYAPLHFHVLRDILRSFPMKCEDFIFVDFGSGKGRAVLLASGYPFKKIIGVELAPQLHAIALRNVQSYRRQKPKCGEIDLVHADATNYLLPTEPIVGFFNNPFGESAMRRVLHNIRESLELYPRPILIIYCNPVLSHLFDTAVFLKKVQPMGQHSQYCSLYTNKDHAGSLPGAGQPFRAR